MYFHVVLMFVQIFLRLLCSFEKHKYSKKLKSVSVFVIFLPFIYIHYTLMLPFMSN